MRKIWLRVLSGDVLRRLLKDNYRLGCIVIKAKKWGYLEYIDFQKRLRETIKGEFPLRWEFKTWNEAARGIDQ